MCYRRTVSLLRTKIKQSNSFEPMHSSYCPVCQVSPLDAAWAGKLLGQNTMASRHQLGRENLPGRDSCARLLKSLESCVALFFAKIYLD
mmetsp:Transcript_3823/g.6745  ORF Transcript_3823/g.6745 Transcript_3823/m.6745 type:complete len:89 (+) Transcript_3823:2270-2536(+)